MAEEYNVPEINRVAATIARKVCEQFPETQPDDIAQEVWEWTINHLEWLKRWGEGWIPKLYTSGYRIAYSYARRDRAARLGYEPRDEYFYSPGQLRKLLPLFFEERPIEPIIPDRDIVLDLQRGLGDLDPESYALLRLIYKGDLVEERMAALAASWGISPEAADKRVYRALKRLQKALGGPNPHDDWHGRTAISNAQAAAITRRQYGEG